MLRAPESNFKAEVERLKPSRPKFEAVDGDRRALADQSLEAELTDVRKALKEARVPEPEFSRICVELERERRRLAQFIEDDESWRRRQGSTFFFDTEREPRPEWPEIQAVAGLPAEFADYFAGYCAWHNPNMEDKQPARQAWERLLERPEAERRYKSTWAAYMLGRSWEETEPARAIAFYQQVRDLARKGFRDTLGLAAASLGREARVHLHNREFEPAIELYLEQLGTGDSTALTSLKLTAARAVNADQATLVSMARNSRVQKVVTAWIISRERYHEVFERVEGDGGPSLSVADKWLRAVEVADTKDMDSAEMLALAAYAANDLARAQAWIKRSPNSAVSQWLQAKLLLGQGKLPEAARLITSLAAKFPVVHEGTNAPAAEQRMDWLAVERGDYSCNVVSAERQVLAELGALRLSRGEFLHALDSLLNAGFWRDAAYVAERVLTLAELKDYVDEFWPSVSAAQVAAENDTFSDSEVNPAHLREKVRYLLARRLTRELRGDLAREYYPTQWLTAFDQLAAELRVGWDEAQPAELRAGALFRAAMITRTNGMELIGTEVAPDWTLCEGRSDLGWIDEDHREERATTNILGPTEQELSRSAAHVPDPDARFHYRYQAAALAWEAAKLLPNNDDRTAYVLWQGGMFLKYQDPDYADLFYKALVRRNRNTVLGRAADEQRWFPVISENGEIVPRKPLRILLEPAPDESSTEETENSEPGPQPEEIEATPAAAATRSEKGYEYIVHRGDSLASIAQGFAEAGVAATRESILEANPGLDGTRLRIGQKILIPVLTR